MNIEEMKHDDIQVRLREIEKEMTADDADLEKLSAEVDALQQREASLKARAESLKELRTRVAGAQVKTIDSIKSAEAERREENNMEEMELRKSLEEALAESIKGRATEEQRALLTTNATGGKVAVDTIIDEFVWTDWEKSPLLSRIRKVNIKGNYRVGYEVSATGAVKHTEGAAAPAEETLVIAYIDFVAEYTKKWIKVSDTVMALKGRAFLDYLFDEFGHQLALALENQIIAEIQASSLTASVTNAMDSTATMAGFAALSDEAVNPVVICSKTTYATIMNERTTAGAKIEEPFMGFEVLFNSTVTGLLVGDLDGVVGNFPEGDEFKYIVDETTFAEQDLVKIVGKILCSIHLVRPNGFAHVTAA